MSIKIGEYILRNNAVLEYPDGSLIDLKKANVENIGIMPEDNNWVVTLLTKAAIFRLQNNTKDTLEVIGFRFDTFKEAAFAHNLFCMELFDIDKEQNNARNE